MGKSMLIIDTPNGCGGCPCLRHRDYVGWVCEAKSEIINKPIPQNCLEKHKRPRWCPLKKLPDKVEKVPQKIKWPEV